VTKKTNFGPSRRQQIFLFPFITEPSLDPAQRPVHWVPEALSLDKATWGGGGGAGALKIHIPPVSANVKNEPICMHDRHTYQPTSLFIYLFIYLLICFFLSFIIVFLTKLQLSAVVFFPVSILSQITASTTNFWQKSKF
jgi:hypothetical protein